MTNFQPYQPAETCDVKRRWTSAVCEKPPDHADEHGGRDLAGRWHFWNGETK